MKTWGVVCALLSIVLFAATIASMNSCSRSYDVDAQGQLCRVEVTDATKTPPTVKKTIVPWNSTSSLQSLERWVRPGDKVVSTETTGGLWLNLAMTRVEVFRGGQEVMIVRDGHVRFWAITLAVSLFPMICWGIGAIWIVTLSPRRSREAPA